MKWLSDFRREVINSRRLRTVVALPTFLQLPMSILLRAPAEIVVFGGVLSAEGIFLVWKQGWALYLATVLLAALTAHVVLFGFPPPQSGDISGWWAIGMQALIMPPCWWLNGRFRDERKRNKNDEAG